MSDLNVRTSLLISQIWFAGAYMHPGWMPATAGVIWLGLAALTLYVGRKARDE